MARHDHTDFDTAFTDGLRFNERGGQCDTLHVLRSGALDVPSGRVLVCDPVGADATAPAFVRPVPPGRYPVLLSRWTSQARNEGRIAVAKLVLAAAPAARWELALREGEEGRPQRRKTDAAFTVDSGNGCFLDAGRARQWLAMDGEVRESYIEAARPQREDAFVLGVPTAAEMVGFRTGLGDGRYRCWWGLDAAGAPVALAADFDMLRVQEWEEFSFGVQDVGPLMHPRLMAMDLHCELLSVWEGHPIDRRTTLVVRSSSADGVRLGRVEWAVVDGAGNVIPTQVSELREEMFSRRGRLRRLQAVMPFPAGARVRLSVNIGTRPI